jgi:hypothetical protein
VHEDVVGGRVRLALGGVERAALAAVLREGEGGLVGDLAERHDPSMPTLRRATFIIVNIERMPGGLADEEAHGVLQVITQVGEAWMPILCSRPPQKMPLRFPSGRTWAR